MRSLQSGGWSSGAYPPKRAVCVCVCVRVCVSTERPLFAIRCIELCCERCKAEGKHAECVHMLQLVPMWQSEERHRKLKIMM